jgi:anti-sigma regulatory factor (Ser/Thr protein kinase)
LAFSARGTEAGMPGNLSPQGSDEPAEPSPEERHATFEVPTGLAAPRTARLLVGDILELWDCNDHNDVAALLTSELVTNVVRHARTDVRLELSLRESILRVAASDDDPTLPELKSVTVDSVGGRGLQLIDALADQWGVVPHQGGKTIWFDVAVSCREPGA